MAFKRGKEKGRSLNIEIFPADIRWVDLKNSLLLAA
jgi:hypothetical protein